MSSRIEYESHFSEYAQALQSSTKSALNDAGDLALETARSAPSGYRIQAILAQIFRSGAERTSKGLGVWIIAPDWRSLWFELGTYRSRKRKLKAPRSSSSTNRGVKPGYFLMHGVDTARAALPGLLERSFSRIRL